jgi:hypothetical protein
LVLASAPRVDADKHVLRIEMAGSGTTVEFSFTGPGPATSIQLLGRRFRWVKIARGP